MFYLKWDRIIKMPPKYFISTFIVLFEMLNQLHMQLYAH